MRFALACLALAATLALVSAVRASDAAPATWPLLEGQYLTSHDSTGIITIVPVGDGIYAIDGGTWRGAGFFDRDSLKYWGAFQDEPAGRTKDKSRASGTHRGTLELDGSIKIEGEYTSGFTGRYRDVWRRWEPEVAGQGGRDRRGEKEGASLPEAITRVKPSYPDFHGIVDGVVVARVLVGEDGSVKDAQILRAVSRRPEASALDTFRQWKFKPARLGGRPIAVWIAIPVKYTSR